MSKDKIEVNMNVYDIPILVEALEKANKEIERLQKENQILMNSMVTEAHTKETKEIERLNNIINELKNKITKAIKLLNKYRNRKDTYCLWCMDYGDNAEVIKILGGKVK